MYVDVKPRSKVKNLCKRILRQAPSQSMKLKELKVAVEAHSTVFSNFSCRHAARSFLKRKIYILILRSHENPIKESLIPSQQMILYSSYIFALPFGSYDFFCVAICFSTVMLKPSYTGTHEHQNHILPRHSFDCEPLIEEPFSRVACWL